MQPIKFVQVLEPGNDINNYADAADSLVQDYEGGTPINQGLPNAGTSSRGRQHKMSRTMPKSLSQWDFHVNRKMYYMAAQGSFNRQLEVDLFHHSCLESRANDKSHCSSCRMIGDIMYFHQAIRQPDAQDFVMALIKGVEAHVKKNAWLLVKREDVPPDMDVFQQYGCIKIECHKARLNIHGCKQYTVPTILNPLLQL